MILLDAIYYHRMHMPVVDTAAVITLVLCLYVLNKYKAYSINPAQRQPIKSELITIAGLNSTRLSLIQQDLFRICQAGNASLELCKLAVQYCLLLDLLFFGQKRVLNTVINIRFNR